MGTFHPTAMPRAHRLAPASSGVPPGGAHAVRHRSAAGALGMIALLGGLAACDSPTMAPAAASEPSELVAGSASLTPAALTATVISPYRVILWWPATPGVWGYQLYRRTYRFDGTVTPWASLAWFGASTLSHDDRMVPYGTGVQYQLRACDGGNCFGWRTTGVLPLVRPATPANLAGNVAGPTRIDLTWAAVGIEATLLQLQRLGPGSTTTTFTLARNVTAYSDAGLPARGIYRYRIRACNPAVCSDWGSTPPLTMPGTIPPPATIAASLTGMCTVDVAWSPSAIADRYVLQRRSNLQPGWATVAQVDAGTVSYADDCAGEQGVAWQYQVRACDWMGCSGWTVSTPVRLPPLPAPAEVVATRYTRTLVRVTWDAAITATMVQVQRRSRTPEEGVWGGWVQLPTPLAGSTSYWDTGVAPWMRYQYQVRACNLVGCSGWGVSEVVAT